MHLSHLFLWYIVRVEYQLFSLLMADIKSEQDGIFPHAHTLVYYMVCVVVEHTMLCPNILKLTQS